GSTAEPEPEHQHYNQCEPVPGDRILQMLVAQVDFERPGTWQPAGGCGLSNSMKNGATSPQFLAAAIATGSRTNQRLCPGSSCGEKAPRDSGQRITPTKSAVAGGDPGGPRRRILPSLRHEAAIDDHDPAGGDLSWREHPVAGSGHIAAQGRAARINECFRTRHERGREFDATELIACRSKTRPALTRRP